MADMADKMIGIFIGAILAAALIPVALQGLAGGIVADNLTKYGGYNWSGTDVIVNPGILALYGIISIAVIVVVVVMFFRQI